jgi:hypothetical protein
VRGIEPLLVVLRELPVHLHHLEQLGLHPANGGKVFFRVRRQFFKGAVFLRLYYSLRLFIFPVSTENRLKSCPRFRKSIFKWHRKFIMFVLHSDQTRFKTET